MTLKLLVALVLLPGLAGAQSLGDVARKEKERRKRAEEAGVKPRELTDKDLKSGKGTLANDPAGEPADAEVKATSQPASSDPEAKPSAQANPRDAEEQERRRNEAEWRQRVATARKRAEDAREFYEYLNGLSLNLGDKYVDEQGRPVFTSLEQLRSAIDKAKAASEATQKALDNLLESARRENVPPGWLR